MLVQIKMKGGNVLDVQSTLAMGVEYCIQSAVSQLLNVSSKLQYFNDGQDILVNAEGKYFDVFKKENSILLLED